MGKLGIMRVESLEITWGVRRTEEEEEGEEELVSQIFFFRKLALWFPLG